MKNVHFCAAMALAFVAISAGPAFAAVASDTTVSIPYGDVAAQAVSVAGDAAWIALVGIIGAFAPGVLGFMRITRLDQLLEKQLKAVFEKNAADLVGKTVTIDVKNRMIAEAARMAVNYGQASLIKWAGAESLQDKLLARWTDTLNDWLSKQKK